MKKIDLDDIELKARKVAATGHGKAASAPVTLALIARIRELEAAVPTYEELRGLQLIRQHLDEGGHDWRAGRAMVDVAMARGFLDRLAKAAGLP